MNKTFQTLQYVMKSFTGVTTVGLLSILATVAMTDLVFQLTDTMNTDHQLVSLTVPFEVITGIFALLTGLLLFLENFKVVLANGVSRKTYLLAYLFAAVVPAAVYSLFNLIVVESHSLVWKINFISSLVYPIDRFGIWLLQMAIYFCLIILGWVISLAYYRSSVPVRWIISIAPFVFLYLIFADAGRTTLYAIEELVQASLGLETGDRNPYKAVGTMLTNAALLSGLAYLLIRRAPLKA